MSEPQKSVTSPEQARIAGEEAYWTAPRLFGAGFVFLGTCIVLIYVMASL
jgi:hypothetical protein